MRRGPFFSPGSTGGRPTTQIPGVPVCQAAGGRCRSGAAEDPGRPESSVDDDLRALGAHTSGDTRSTSQPFGTWGSRMTKRAFDLLGAVAGLVVLGPVLLAIAA